MYGYIYMTTNLLDGKKYIGKHKAIKFDRSYQGSGKHLIRAIEKYGKENFKTEVFYWCETLDELNQKEIETIEKFDAVNSAEFYNLARGGEGHTAKFSSESLEKLRQSHIGQYVSPETRQKLSIISRERWKRINEECKRTGRVHKHKNPMTEEQKRKIVESRRAGKGYTISEETRQKMRDSHKNQVPWNKGLRKNSKQGSRPLFTI